MMILINASLASVDFVAQVITGNEIHWRTEIGPGLRIHHSGNVIINSRTIIGRECTLHHGVTLGSLSPGGGAPTLGDRVELGAYAQVLGGVRIGDGARVGAMSVVLQDVPAGLTAVGVPARIRTTGG